MSITVYIILDWLNEYFEITPEHIFHKEGIFYQDEKKVNISQVNEIELKQGVLGKILNFGSISLYNYRHDLLMDLYLIHNPNRYNKILEKLCPDIDEEKHLIRGSFIDIEKSIKK